MRRLVVLLSALVTLCGAGALAPSASADVLVADDTPERSWRVNGRVYATLVVGDRVLVGGSFTSATNGTRTVNRSNLAMFELSTGNLVETWRADADRTVRVIEARGTNVWVGGEFRRVNGLARRAVAKIALGSGAVDTGFNARVNGFVRGVSSDALGNLYIGGGFSSAGGQSRSRLAKVDADSGALVAAFNGGGAANVVNDIEVSPAGTVWVGGTFARLGGRSVDGLGGVNPVTGAATGPTFPVPPDVTFALDVNETGSQLFVAGGAQNNSAQSYNTATGARQWVRRAMGDMQAIDYHSGTVYFGFHEGFGGDTSVRVLAATSSNGALDSELRPTFNRFLGVWSISATDNGLVVGGVFTRVSGVAAEGWVRFR